MKQLKLMKKRRKRPWLAAAILALCVALVGSPLAPVIAAGAAGAGSPPTKAGFTDIEELTDDEISAVADLNLLFAQSPWQSVNLRSGNVLDSAAYTTAITGNNTSLSGISNATSWPVYNPTKADQIDMLYAPLFNGVVTVGDIKYSYAFSNGITSMFFMMDAAAADSVIKPSQGTGVTAAAYTKIAPTFTVDSQFNGLVDNVKVYTDQAGHRLAKVMTLSDWQIADVATIDPNTGSISHNVFYKNLGATRSNIRLGSQMDIAVSKANTIGRVKLDRLQVTADGYDGAYITGVIPNNPDDPNDRIADDQQSTTLVDGGLIMYSDPVDPTKTEVYAGRTPTSQKVLGDTMGLVATAGQEKGTALVGKKPDPLYDSSMFYLSKPIATLPTGGTVRLQYIERLSDKMTATVRYQDVDTGEVLARQDIVGNIDDPLNFVDTATFMAQNANKFTGYEVVSDNTAEASNYTFQSSLGTWIVELKKVPIYTPDDNPKGLPLTATATEGVNYLKDGAAFQQTPALATVKLYRYVTAHLDDTYEYSDWTTSEAEANAHKTITKANPTVAALTQAQIDAYLPDQYRGEVTKLKVGETPETAVEPNQVLTADDQLAEWLSQGGDLAITRTVNYTPAQVGPIVPGDPNDPYYAMTHKTLTVKVVVDDAALAADDQAAVALGDEASQTIAFERTVTYSGDDVIALGAWTPTNTLQDVTAKAVDGYVISPASTVTEASLTSAVGGTVAQAQVGQSLKTVLANFQADDNGGITGATHTNGALDGTATTEISYSMKITYPQAGARANLWTGLLAAAFLALGAVGLLCRQKLQH